MKKWTGLPLILAVMILLSACGKQNATQAQTTDTVPVILNQSEYLLYQNVFYNDFGQEIKNKEVTKRGVFAAVQDAFSDRVRYYVWGYLDNTKCCDWQWEFVPGDPDGLPPVGSLVTVTGTFAFDEDNALDGWWIMDASVQAEMTYTGAASEINMFAMDCTLERVQMISPIISRARRFPPTAASRRPACSKIPTTTDPGRFPTHPMPNAPPSARLFRCAALWNMARSATAR